MIVIDEYVALRVLDPAWDNPVLDERMILPYTRHWRLISAIAAPTVAGQLSARLKLLAPDAIEFIRRPHPDVIHIPDPREHALLAADLMTATGPTSLMFSETLAACVVYESAFHAGLAQNAVGKLAGHAQQLGIAIEIVE